MTLLLGIDIGTSSTKSLLIDEGGSVVGSAEAPHAISRPNPGWSEQEPDWWWSAAVRSVRWLLEKHDAAEIAAVGFSGQMHGSVFLPGDADPADPRPVRPAILWNDQRTGDQCAEIERAAGGRSALIDMVGNPALTGFTAPKILWLKEHEPHNYKRTTTVLMPKDYVRFRMTGRLATDAGDASGTLLLDPKTRRWHDDLIAAIGLDRRMFPECVESPAYLGDVSDSAAGETGLLAGTPVVAGSGDQMTGAVGAGIVRHGLVSATLGTSGVVFAHAGKEAPSDPHGRIQVMCAAVPNEYCVYGCMLSAAGALQWFRDACATGETFPSLDSDAAGAPLGADGLVFLPYLTGERCPHPDPTLRGAFIGLSARHTRGHLARAVMEGVAFGMGGILDLVRALRIEPSEIRLSGGGARSDLWRQIHTDVFRTRVTTLATSEGSAYGAAILAGVGLGVWPSVEQACDACVKVSSCVDPDPSRSGAYSRIRKIYDDLYPGMHEFSCRLAVPAERHAD